MNLREQLDYIRRYFERVGENEAEPLVCPIDSALQLYRVDHEKNEVYIQCLYCARRTYPGTAWWNSIKRRVDGRDNVG